MKNLFDFIGFKSAFYDFAVQTQIPVNFAVQLYRSVAFDMYFVGDEMVRDGQIHMFAPDEFRQNAHDSAVFGHGHYYYVQFTVVY